ncbi:AraC-like DNA-binding protein [Streptomyces canus]|uniref:AraC-like DNA-binding protein n=1 Tax=Streptomyces canus TaxID=58343 RepID=A0AAW8FIK6_9ACTN|nr:helix-turn-helix domain-containing protein [Streptomyces canus]MDQ0908860.1 AraC-like DNA-binding protein [Streptomyces canus]
MDAEIWTKELGRPGSTRELGAVRLSAVRCPATELPGGGTGAPGGHRYHLTLLLGGALALDQEDRSARPGPGDLVLVDGGRPFQLALTAPRNVLVTAHLPVVPGDPAQCVARTIGGRQGLGALVSGLLTGLARDTTFYRPADERRLGVAVLELTGALLDQGRPDPAPQPLLPRIQAYVLAHLGDGPLTPDDVAAAHHISTRYLHRLFQRQGLTVAAWIKTQRLERCRRDLADPRLAHLPVHAVAARWGFAQPADFSRAFRTAYRISPTCFRGRSLPTNSARAANDRHLTAQQTHG